MLLPPWAVFALAAWLILFGSFRIVLGLRAHRRGEGEGPRRGLFPLGWRRQVIFGIFYIVVGAYLVAMGFGYGIPTAMAPEEPVPLPSQRSEHLTLD